MRPNYEEWLRDHVEESDAEIARLIVQWLLSQSRQSAIDELTHLVTLQVACARSRVRSRSSNRPSPVGPSRNDGPRVALRSALDTRRPDPADASTAQRAGLLRESPTPRVPALAAITRVIPELIGRYKACVRLDLDSKLLAEEFSIGRHKTVRWGTATAEQHERAAATLAARLNSNVKLIAQHELSAESIRRAGVNHLNDLHAAGVRHLGAAS